MEYLVGITLAVFFCAGAAWLGMDRERVFYPAVVMAVASYYLAFAVADAMAAKSRATANWSSPGCPPCQHNVPSPPVVPVILRVPQSIVSVPPSDPILLADANADSWDTTRSPALPRVSSQLPKKLVVSRTDPGHPNWVSTAGRGKGLIWLRWFLPEETPARPVCRVVDIEDLK